MFADLSFPLQIVAFLALFYLVVRSSYLIIDAASELANKFGVSELIIGLTVVAIGTSAPEFAVTSFASLQGSSGVALGNVVGSNIFNVGIILALFAIYKPIPVREDLLYRDTTYLLISTLALCYFASSGATISRLEGLIFCSMLLVYLLSLALVAKGQRDLAGKRVAWLSLDNESLKILSKLVLGFAVLLICSKGIVDLAIHFARDLGVSEWLIGTTIVAAGTSLPELVTALTAITRKKVDIGIGNIVGSELFNILGVVGVAALISPLSEIDELAPFYLLLSTTVFLAFAMRTGWVLSRLEGFVLMGFAVLRWGVAV